MRNCMSRDDFKIQPEHRSHRVETITPDLRKEDVTWSVLHGGGGWSKTHRITHGRVGAELPPSSTMKNAPCHIPP